MVIIFWRFSTSYFDTLPVKGSLYRKTCIRQPLLGPLKSGRLRQVSVLHNTFIKRSQAKFGRSWQVIFSFICLNKNVQLRIFAAILEN